VHSEQRVTELGIGMVVKGIEIGADRAGEKDGILNFVSYSSLRHTD